MFKLNIDSKKRTTCSGLMKPGLMKPGLMKPALNNVVLPTLFTVVNNIVQHCWAWISALSGVTMLNNIVDNIEQCGQHNIVQGCFHQPWTGWRFYACIWIPLHHPVEEIEISSWEVLTYGIYARVNINLFSQVRNCHIKALPWTKIEQGTGKDYFTYIITFYYGIVITNENHFAFRTQI